MARGKVRILLTVLVLLPALSACARTAVRPYQIEVTSGGADPRPDCEPPVGIKTDRLLKGRTA
jgi:hypothetical protein